MTIPQLIWKRLHMTNTWLFIANIPTSAAIVCRGVREDVILNGTGVIHTSPECSIQTRGNILKSEVITQYPVITTFSKTIRPPEIEAAKADKLEKIPPEPVLKATDLFSGLTIQDNAEENGTWRTVGPHFYSSMATITAMAIIILIIYLIRRRGFAVWFRKITLKQPTKEDRAEEPPAEELQEGHPTPPPRPNYVERRIGLSRRAECLYGQCNALST